MDDSRVHLDSEIALLRETWHTLRGDGWEPLVGLADRIRRGEARSLALYKQSRKAPDAQLYLVDGSAHDADMFGAEFQVWLDVKAFVAEYKRCRAAVRSVRSQHAVYLQREMDLQRVVAVPPLRSQ
ncbi:hypothetical protein ACFY1J_45765 [Streptomyces sp. NPDC001406]|uniref:hypothetical protein n=1 Tax=Streptomyces sp. NPDC001406 TaxID=3364572 RepID=UPI0036841663